MYTILVYISVDFFDSLISLCAEKRGNASIPSRDLFFLAIPRPKLQEKWDDFFVLDGFNFSWLEKEISKMYTILVYISVDFSDSLISLCAEKRGNASIPSRDLFFLAIPRPKLQEKYDDFFFTRWI